jgi:uracil-DNA glycosylase
MMTDEIDMAVSSIFDDIAGYLSFLKHMGCDGVERPEAVAHILESWKNPFVPDADSLDAIYADLKDCRRCKLCENREKIVFGAGNERARLIFVGECPGKEEDLAGEPFVGDAGKLLTKIIEAITMTRDQVYLCDVVKCRPPENRKPGADEILACSGFLRRQIDVIRPDFICALGPVATQSLLDKDLPISALRGRFHDYRGTKLLPTHHPDCLLDQPEKKRETWEDMKLLMKAMGIEKNG